MPHHRPDDDDTDEIEITNEQVGRMPRHQRPTIAQRFLGRRDADHRLRHLATIATLCVMVISICGSMWRAGSTVEALVSTLQHVGPVVDSLGKQVRDLGTSVVVLNSRMDSLSAHEARRDAVDSARFAELEKATAAVNHATAAMVRHRQ